MPKKGKGKSPGPAGGKSAKPEALPQVWLPDQVSKCRENAPGAVKQTWAWLQGLQDFAI